MNNNTGRRRVRRARQQKQANVKPILLMICMMALVAVVSVGATVAWLTDKTENITNTFTTSYVDITLTETDEDNEFQMIPGDTITKDPKVTVLADSEASYVFVKVEKSANYDQYLADYVMATDWTPVQGVTGVYYQMVDATTADVALQVLKDDQVVVRDTVTNAMMVTAETNKPTLTFTAYAIQQLGFATPELAWAEVSANGTTFVK